MYNSQHKNEKRIMIREAVEDDIPRIQEIERESISPPWSHGGLLNEIFRDDSFFALAIDTDMDAHTHSDMDTIMGFIILRHTADEGDLFQIAVDAAYRRRGAADTLISKALEWGWGRGIIVVYLEVRKSNAAAIALYEKHGFKKSSLRKRYYINPVEDAIVMTRSNGEL